MIYFDTSYVSVEWDKEIKGVLITWKGFASSPQYREALEKALELIKLEKATGYIGDTRAFRVISPADQDWTIEDWLVRARAAGALKSATVVPQDVLGQLSLQRMLELRETIHHVKPAYFDTIEAAREWLISQ